MFTLWKNALVFAPQELGTADVLVAAGKILGVAPGLGESVAGSKVEVIDAQGRILTPGIIDQHVHLLGGGGGAGYASRGPELSAGEALLAGTTTVVGCLGVDQVARDLTALLAKTRSLSEQGVTAKMYTGGFDPTVTVTGSVERDIYLLDNVIGSKAAVSEKRSYHLTPAELVRLIARTAVGGGLAGKAGVTHVHVGDLPSGLSPLQEAVAQAGVAIGQVVPTHLNRDQALVPQIKQWIAMGGVVDLSVSFCPPRNAKAVKAGELVKELLAWGAPLENLTISTDGNSVPTLGGLDQAQRVPLNLLHHELVDMVRQEGISLAEALAMVTLNVARLLKLGGKGAIEPGCDADMLLLNPQTLAVEYVMAGGEVVIRQGTLTTRELIATE